VIHHEERIIHEAFKQAFFSFPCLKKALRKYSASCLRTLREYLLCLKKVRKEYEKSTKRVQLITYLLEESAVAYLLV
jgi:hypothetical protein